MNNFAYITQQKRIQDRHPLLRHWDYRGYMDGRLLTATGTDLDWMETQENKPIAYLEYKFGYHNSSIDLHSSQFDVLCEAARLKNGTLPVFCVVYFFYSIKGTLLQAENEPNSLDTFAHADYLVIPVNKKAKTFTDTKHMTELHFHQFLFDKLRNIPAPKPLTTLCEHLKTDSTLFPKIDNEHLHED